MGCGSVKSKTCLLSLALQSPKLDACRFSFNDIIVASLALIGPCYHPPNRTDDVILVFLAIVFRFVKVTTVHTVASNTVLCCLIPVRRRTVRRKVHPH